MVVVGSTQTDIDCFRFISQKFCSKPMFAALWSLYFSLYQVGQTFLWFQWYVLILTVFLLTNKCSTVWNSRCYCTVHTIKIWLVPQSFVRVLRKEPRTPCSHLVCPRMHYPLVQSPLWIDWLLWNRWIQKHIIIIGLVKDLKNFLKWLCRASLI